MLREASRVKLTGASAKQSQLLKLAESSLFVSSKTTAKPVSRRRRHSSSHSSDGTPGTPLLGYQNRPYIEGSRLKGKHGGINYALFGSSENALVVCIHGLNGSKDDFLEVGQELAHRGFCALIYDLWGHGLSASPELGNYDTGLFVGQIEEILYLLGMRERRRHLIGYSMGGYIAVASGVFQPSLTKSVLLLSPAGLLKTTWAAERAAVRGCIGYVTRPLIRCGFECCFMSPEECELVPDDSEELMRSALLMNEHSFKEKRSINTLLAVMRGMPLWENYDMFERLAATRIPVHFFWGTEDTVVPLEECEVFLNNTFPNPVKKYEDVDHGTLGNGQVLRDVFSQLKRLSR